jgi:iron(III) transport system permease protein
VLGVLTVWPLLMLFYGSIHSTPPGQAGEFNLDGYRQLMSSTNVRVFVVTTLLSLTKTVLSLGLAIALAWIVARTDTPARGLLEVLITLPFFIPPVLTAMAWGMLGNPQVGALNQLWRWITGTEGSPINVYSYGGVIWHMMQYSTPFLFLVIVDAFRFMDPSLEEAARMSGASRLQVLRGITLTLLLPVLTSAFLLSFIRGMEAFESALVFGNPAGIKVVTTTIYDAITQRAVPDYQYATALSFAVMALMVLLVLSQRLVLRSRNFQTVTGKSSTPRTVRLGRWRWAAFGFCICFFAVTVMLPIAQLVAGSLFENAGFYTLDSLTLDHWRVVFDNGEVWRGMRNTMLLGLVGATVTMLLGGLVAYVTVRTRWPGRQLVATLAWLPWLMPGVVMGIGLLWMYSTLPGPIQIYGTVWALLLAYIALGTPLGVQVMSSSFVQLSRDLEECSRVHGASWLKTFYRILLALAWPSFAVGWMLTFFGIMRELSASILLYAVGSEVLSVELMKLWTDGRVEEVSVLGLMVMLLVFLFRWVQLALLRKRGATAALH